MKPLLERARRRLGQWTRRELEESTPGAVPFADRDAPRDTTWRTPEAQTELEGSAGAPTSWARDLGKRLADSTLAVGNRNELRMLSETVGGLAHNLNNSLAAILAHAEMMLRDAQTDKAKRRLTVIRDVALEASTMVRRMQDFVSSRPHDVGAGPVGLSAVIADAVDMTAPLWRDEAQRRGITITVNQDLEALLSVEGNALELRDVIVGLILNAVLAMPLGGVLTIRAASEASGWVVVEARDTGVGMADDACRKVTERLHDVRPDRDSGYSLDHVADIVSRHGGSLAIESVLGEGTTVKVRLHAHRFQIIPPSRSRGERRPAQPARVLLVDDDARLVAVLSDMLRAEGHAVTIATDSEAAFGLFDPARHDVLITDLGMPGINGWELARRIKSRSPNTVVFILTGWGESVLADDSSRFVDRVIAKPVSVEALLDQLAELTGSRAPSA
ncbi:MAG TPA: response regulator [Candidatus Methylomirabilis sp.]|nr:response regulator [Candidatus Methylomirabilis sp.]